MNETMLFKIVTPYGIIYESDVQRVTVPTTTGEITVLPNHAPLVSTLAPGEIIVHKDGTPVSLAVSTGILEIRPENQMYILADTAERAEHIDIARAEEARKRAEELLRQEHDVANVDFARIQSTIERELARISVGNKYRNAR